MEIPADERIFNCTPDHIKVAGTSCYVKCTGTKVSELPRPERRSFPASGTIPASQRCDVEVSTPQAQKAVLPP